MRELQYLFFLMVDEAQGTSIHTSHLPASDAFHLHINPFEGVQG